MFFHCFLSAHVLLKKKEERKTAQLTPKYTHKKKYWRKKNVSIQWIVYNSTRRLTAKTLLHEDGQTTFDNKMDF